MFITDDLYREEQQARIIQEVTGDFLDAHPEYEGRVEPWKLTTGFELVAWDEESQGYETLAIWEAGYGLTDYLS